MHRLSGAFHLEIPGGFDGALDWALQGQANPPKRELQLGEDNGGGDAVAWVAGLRATGRSTLDDEWHLYFPLQTVAIADRSANAGQPLDQETLKG